MNLRWLIFVICLIGCNCVSWASLEKEFDIPTFVAANTRQIEVEQVNMMQDRTEVLVRLWGNPGSKITIDPRMALVAEGKHYTLTGIEGLAPEADVEFYPESGEIGLYLLFPALPANTLTVDLIEGDGGWKVWGIQVKGNEPYVYVPSFLTSRQMDFTVPLPAVDLHPGRTIINGYLLGYTEDMQVELNLHLHDWLFANEWGYPIEVNEDGSFHAELNLLLAGGATLRVNQSELPLFLQPGDEMMLYVHLPILSMAGSRLLGEHYRERQKAWFDARTAPINTELATWGYPLSVYSAANYNKELCLSGEKNQVKYVWRKFIKERNRILKDNRLSEACRTYLLVNLEMEAFLAFASGAFSGGELNNQLEQKLMDLSFIHSPYVGYGRQYYAYLQTIEKHYPDKLKLPDVWSDLKKVHPFCEQLMKNRPLSDSDKNELQHIHVPELVQYVAEVNKQVEAEIGALEAMDGFAVLQADTVLSGQEVLQQLVKNYHGQVVVVDFWATWCAPCRKSMPAVSALKKQLSGEKCVFIYLTGPDSPEKIWSTAIKQMHGIHVRLTQKQWKELGASYGITGIPAYLIMDKRGELYRQFVGFPGTTALKQTILKLLK